MAERRSAAAQTPAGADQTSALTEHFLLHLADRLGAKATVSVVYGEPIERQGITIVPVARVRWGFGGGGGNSQARPAGGSAGGSESSQAETGGLGGGANVSITPVGYIEIANGMTEFRRISE